MPWPFAPLWRGEKYRHDRIRLAYVSSDFNEHPVAAVISELIERDDTIRALGAQGIQSKPYLPAIHLMSFYRERFGHREGEFPVCEDVAARSIALPFFPQMTDGQVERVSEALREVLQ